MGRMALNEGEVNGALELPDGRVLSWSADRTLRIWNSQTGEVLVVLEGHGRAVTGTALLSGGKLLSWSASGRSLRIWDSATGASLGQIELEVEAEGLLPLEGDRLLSWDDQGVLSILDSHTGRRVRVLGRHEDARNAYITKLESVEKHLELNPDDWSERLFGANALLALGETERAFAWASEIRDSGTNDALILYNLACIYSMAGDVESSLELLERAIDAGDRDPAWWRQDTDLDNVRRDPRFDELLERMERLVAQEPVD